MFIAKSPFVLNNWDLLQQEIRDHFGDRLISAATTDYGANIAAFLIDGDMADHAALGQILAAHDPDALAAGQLYEQYLNSAQAQWDASILHNKAPAQIITYLQSNIDGWTTLAEAKSDLREWLVIIAVALAYLAKAEKVQG